MKKIKNLASGESFPKGFTWGVATAAPQIEGGWDKGGKGPSIWDHYSTIPGNVVNAETPHVACDHYRRFRSDFKLMRNLGIRHYRFSAAWPRVCPEGTERINPKGLDFYDKLVDSMLGNEITPWCTLFHWDLPLRLEEKGGWTNRTTVEMFRHYSNALVGRIGDRVRNWFTVNEIFCFINAGYEHAALAPFKKESKATIRKANHHALLAHGHGVEAIRAGGHKDSKIGFAFNPAVYIPVCESEPDITASRRRFQETNGLHLGPVLQGKYPAEYLSAAGDDFEIKPGDMKLIGQTTDFVGFNVYTGSFVREGKGGDPEDLPMTAHFPKSDCSWMYLTPQAIYWAMRHTDELYGNKSYYLTENGSSYPLAPDQRGEVLDLDRIQYLKLCLNECQRAVRQDIDLKGYFLWSFLDNYEWAMGYGQRFGIVHVDYSTQKRTPKLSAHWYSEVMRLNKVL